MAKVRFWRTTKGENAEGYVAKAIAYTTQATLALFQANAAEGEVGIFDADTQALLAANSTLPNPSGLVGSTVTGAGLITAGTYYYVIVGINANGHTSVSNEIAIATTTATSTNNLSWNPLPGAISYQIWRGTTAGAEDHFQTSAVNSFSDTSAAGGTAGTVPSTNTATTGAAQPLVEGQKYFIAQKRDGQTKKSTVLEYHLNRSRRTPYVAPVKQVTTLNFSAAMIAATTLALGDDAEINLIELTPGNEPYPDVSYDATVDAAGTTLSTLLDRIVARINNPVDLVHRDDGLQYSATKASDGAGGYDVVITAYYYGQYFRVNLRGPLAGGTITYTTPFKQGVGFSDAVSRDEDEYIIYDGVTTNYPGQYLPSEFGTPTKFTVAGLTYNAYNLDPLKISKEPMPQGIHHYFGHVHLWVPVPVGGNAAALAASSPDLAIKTILGL